MLEMSEGVFCTAVIFCEVLDSVCWPFSFFYNGGEFFYLSGNQISCRFYQSFFSPWIAIIFKKEIFFLAGTAVYALN